MYTLFRTARPKNHTLSSGTSPSSPSKGVPPPPGGALHGHEAEVHFHSLEPASDTANSAKGK